MTRRVLVTGAAGAIGTAVVNAFLAQGWRVAGLDRRPPEQTGGYAGQQPPAPGADVRAAGAGAGAGAQPHGPLWLTADLTDELAVSAAVDQIATRWGGLDALVNNAAFGPPRAPVGRETPAHLRTVLEVNLVAPLGIIQATLPLLAAGEAASVVQLSSIGATRAFRGNAAYAASKGGLEALTRALALDLARHGIRVNAVAPAMVGTPGWDGGGPEEARRRSRLVPLGRPGSVTEIASAVAFLAGPESSYITGVVLPVDGGLGIQAYSQAEEPGVAATIDPESGVG